MAFIPLPNGFRVAMEFGKNGQVVVNVYHITSTLPVNTTNLTALAQVFRTWWNSPMRANFTGNIALTNVVITDISVPNGLQVNLAVSPTLPGTLAGISAPNNVASVLSWRTGLTGRSFRGRTYYSGMAASEVTDDQLDQPRVNAIISAGQNLLTQLNVSSAALVVASFYQNNAPRLVGLSTPINAIVMNNRIDTQRRRLPGEGT